MTDQEIKNLDHYKIWDILHDREIHSSYRSGSDGNVWVIAHGKHRLASEEETKLHEQAGRSYLMEEAQTGLI
jgi:hypothetical protein